MSNLRIILLGIGILGLLFTFLINKGQRLKRANFILFTLFYTSMIALAANPDFGNIISNMFALRDVQRGRILALLIASNIVCWFFVFYLKSRSDEYKIQFDLLVRRLGRDVLQNNRLSKLMSKDIVVIIPAYNEAKSLEELLKKMPQKIGKKNLGVLIIDDGSSDKTSELAGKYGCACARNIINRGQGAANRLGYDILLHNNVEIGVTMDADGQHMPDEIGSLVEPIIDNRCDLVIGSRVLGKSEEDAFLRKIGVFFWTKVINFLTGAKLTDCSSGFKAFNMNKIKFLALTEDQFQSAEVIIKSARRGLKMGEVPITISKRKHGKSKKGKDIIYGFGFAKSIAKAWWR